MGHPNGKANKRLTRQLSLGSIIYVAALLSLTLLAYWTGGETNNILRFLRFVIFPIISIYLATLLATYFAPKLIGLKQSNGLQLIIICSIAIYVIVFSSLKSMKLRSSNYEFFDAGLYLNKLWILKEKRILDGLYASSFDGHFQPILYIFALIHKINPGMSLPFYFETLLLASGALPIYFAAKSLKLPPAATVLIPICFLLNPLVQFNDILGFHPDHIVLPSLLWAFYFAILGKHLFSFVALLFLCLAGTQWIALASSFGAYLWLMHKKKWIGAAISFSFAVMFFGLLFVALPLLGSSNSGAQIFASEGQSAYVHLSNFDLKKTSEVIFEPRKLFFIFFVFFPLLFLPIFSIPTLAVSIPDFAKIVLSSEQLHYSVEGHYTLGIIAVAFFASIHTLDKIKNKYGMLATLRLAIACCFLTFSMSIIHGPAPHSINFWTNFSSAAFNKKNYVSGTRTTSIEKVQTILDQSENPRIQLTNGAFFTSLAQIGKLDLFPTKSFEDTDYVLLAKHRSLGSGSHSGDLRYQAQLQRSESELNKSFEVIYEDKVFQLWSKLAPR